MIASETDTSPTDVAVVGLSLRVPGARTPVQFWRNLRNGVESIRTLSPEELAESGETPERMRRKNYVARTAELPGFEGFDADFFGFSPMEAAIMDPQHRQFLECTWEALESAAIRAEGGGPVGVFAGCGMGSYFYFNVCSHRDLVGKVGMFLLRHTGNDKDFLATRVSYLLDLHGPSVNVQTACSTSLVAIHLACQSLINGECETAIAGGVTIELPHRRGYLYQEGEVLSPDGRCRAFDHRAAGTVFGSGAGVVVLRKLSDALRDGDPIRAVIKATAVNNDGASKAGYLAPSVTGQAEAIVEALALAGVEADTLQYVECHGTGTYLGDPIEVEALSEAFRQSTRKRGFCRIGSAKTNIGHLDTAAGVVGLIKAVLALEHGEIPPSLNFEKPNPAIDFAQSPFVVADSLAAWPSSASPRRAGVNSLGVGGTNAFAVLEEAPVRTLRDSGQETGPQLIVLSAKSRPALDEAGRRLGAHLEEQPDISLADVAMTLGTGRRHLKHRRVVAVADREDAIGVLCANPPSTRSSTHAPVEGTTGAVFLLSGGGAQYPGMARGLYRTEREFARTVDEGLRYLPEQDALLIRELWLQTEPRGQAAAAAFHVASLQLPAILILEVALARLWIGWGITPAALIGHSMGENAAACIAGVLDFSSAVGLVHLRGKLMDEVKGGGMLSVPLASDAVAARLPADLEIAVVNSPTLCVVSGPLPAIEAFHEQLVAEEVEASRIPIDIAAHSRLLDPILARFDAHLRTLKLSAPRIPIISNVTGDWLKPSEATDPGYWTKHLRSTVRFADGLATLAADRTRIYIEVGPGRTLSSLVKAQGSVDANQVINSLPHGGEAGDDSLHFLTAVGRAWATGLPVNVQRLFPNGLGRRIVLPTYPFQHQRYFLDRVAGTDQVQPGRALVKQPDIAEWGWRPVWKSSSVETVLGDEVPATSFLVFLDDAGVGTEMVARLKAQGHSVATVSLGDAFAALGERRFVLCPEQGREGYDQLVAGLAESGGIPERIVHLWLLTDGEDFRPGSSFFHRNQERGFYCLFFLAQALASTHLTSPLQISVVTNGMQRVGSEAMPYPEKATVLGPAQVIPREIQGASVRVIDVAVEPRRGQRGRGPTTGWIMPESLRGLWIAPSGGGSSLDMLLEDLSAGHGSEIVAYRNGRRWVKSYQPTPLPVANGEGFKQGGTYLVTGGLGGLALTCAEELARRCKAKLILVGRTEMPARSEWAGYLASYGVQDKLGSSMATIQRIEDAGGEALYCRADITNPEAMRRVVAEAKGRFGSIDGVIHTAGVVKDELIQLKATSEIEDVFAPKVLGTLVLEEVLKDEPVDLVVLFSSTSTDIAPVGQVDYVAANAYLNAYAESRSAATGRRVTAIHWGLWNEVGLAARAVRTALGDDAEAVEAAQQPLFDRRVTRASSGDHLELRCDPAHQWLLDEHRLAGGQAVWPGTGYLELFAEAAREFGRPGVIQLEDVSFIRLLHVADGETRTIRVVREVLRSGTRLAVESAVETPKGTAWLRHAEATLVSGPAMPPPQLSLGALADACQGEMRESEDRALPSVQSAQLRFGPRWQVLRMLRLGERRALARLRLADGFADDILRGLILHPALMDIATGCAMSIIPGYDASKGLWVPMTYGRVRVFRSLPAEIWSHARLNEASNPGEGYATFDVSVIDRHGRTLVEVERFTVKHVGHQAGNVEPALRDTTGARLDASTERAGQELSPAVERLVGQVDQGILPKEGAEALLRAVATGLPQIVVSSLDLEQLIASASITDTRPAGSAAFERPAMESEFVGPSNDIERTLAEIWSELLGVQKIGVNDSFFDLGGHSLIAVRLFRRIKQAYAVDFPISVLFEAPTIARTAELIAQSTTVRTSVTDRPVADARDSANVAKPRYTHLVLMRESKSADRAPFFICSGMFGNILNLRHLAIHIGAERTVYGLQARGLYGEQAPHETFEEMARDYLAEVRAVQPHGPYLIGGFSGGGVVAFEMAQQLKDAGEEVALVVMLDTPYPEVQQLSAVDRISMKLQDLKRDRSRFVTNWVKRRIAWELKRLRKGVEDKPVSTEQFHNEEIEAAFRRALARYRGRPYAGPIVNFRPHHEVAYRLRDGIQLDADRSVVRADNGWSGIAHSLRMIAVPGSHDSMVLEPNVRVLTTLMREEMKQAEAAMLRVPAAAE
jgi:acyl transferase domain-containing protein/thioesterase domain-containing protein/short-subunit dehydrogenase